MNGWRCAGGAGIARAQHIRRWVCLCECVYCVRVCVGFYRRKMHTQKHARNIAATRIHTTLLTERNKHNTHTHNATTIRASVWRGFCVGMGTEDAKQQKLCDWTAALSTHHTLLDMRELGNWVWRGSIALHKCKAVVGVSCVCALFVGAPLAGWLFIPCVWGVFVCAPRDVRKVFGRLLRVYSSVRVRSLYFWQVCNKIL